MQFFLGVDEILGAFLVCALFGIWVQVFFQKLHISTFADQKTARKQNVIFFC